MSNSINHINVLNSIEPRMDFHETSTFAIIKGGQLVTYYQYPATSFSNSNMTFNTLPPNNRLVLDRQAFIEVPCRLTFTGGITGATGAPINILNSGKDAPRAYPIASITNTITCSMNGADVTMELSEMIAPLSRYHLNCQERSGFLSIADPMVDQYQEYGFGWGSIRNPLGEYGDSCDNTPMTRGSHSMSIISNGATGAVVDIVFREPVILPPFLFDGHEGKGLTNLDTLVFTWNLLPNLARVWSHANTITAPGGNIIASSQISNLEVVIGGADSTNLINNPGVPTMWLCWVTPKEVETVPRLITYPWYNLVKYVSRGGAASPHYVPFVGPVRETRMSNPIQLSSIPRKLYVFMKQANQVTYANVNNSISSSDVAAGITKINIIWNNNSGLLSACSALELYEISVNNGYMGSYLQWSGEQTYNFGDQTVEKAASGSYFCAEFGKDIGLSSVEAPGIMGNYNLQVQVDYFNPNPVNDVLYDMYLICVYDGIVSVGAGSAFKQLGVISHSDVLNQSDDNAIPYHVLEKVYGGDFFSSVRDFGKKAFDILRKGHDFAKDKKLLSKGLKFIPGPAGPIASTVADVLGYGADGSALSGGRKKKKRAGALVERNVSGGKALTLRQLQKRARN